MLGALRALTTLQRWFCADLLSAKTGQFEFELQPPPSCPLSGTVASCRILRSGRTLEKTLHLSSLSNLDELSRRLSLVARVLGSPAPLVGLARYVHLEGDLVHEHRLLELFHAAWGSPVVPSPVGPAMVDRLRMEYVPWPQLALVAAEGCPSRALSAVVSAGRFFLASVHEHGLLHGDMSVFNVLVDPSDPSGSTVCVVDYGLALELDASEREQMASLEEDPPTPFARELVRAWREGGGGGEGDGEGKDADGEGGAFGSRWSVEVQGLLALSDSRHRALTPVLGLFLRSLLTLTYVRCKLVELVERRRPMASLRVG